jgi:uncharacterized protein
LAPEIVAEIKRRLADIQAAECVTIPFAIESGSRAWGFPSPDSDYDCRFVYLRRNLDLTSLFPKRDVIETELTPVFDVNGWELAKAVKLLLKGNAVILEWLQSPIHYLRDDGFHCALQEFAQSIFDRRLVARHYFHLLRVTYDRHFSDPESIAIKKLFYVLRPAMALAYLREHPESTELPMRFQSLAKSVELDSSLRSLINELLEKKAVTREMGVSAAPKLVLDFINDELGLAEDLIEDRTPRNTDRDQLAELFYQSMLRRFSPQ